MADEAAKLGIIAGAGLLPRMIAEAALSTGRPVFVIAYQGHTDPATVEGVPHIWARLGKAGAVLRTLRNELVQDIVMAGAIRRPSLAELSPDWYTIRFFAKLGRRALGDDGLLRALARNFEDEGFTVVGARDLIGDAMAKPGQLGKLAPSEAERADIDHGIAVVLALGTLDIGQAAVVQDGMVLSVEAAEGTDAMIARTASLARAGSKPVLVKLAKRQQDVRIDLPTIGVATLENAAKAGFAGIAIEAGKTILLEPARLAELADRLGLFLIAIDLP